MCQIYMTTFGEWLTHELKKRDWNKSELARRSNRSAAAISDVISGRRNLGADLAVDIARALKLPEEEVMRAGGLLSEKRKADKQVEEIMHRVQDLSKDDQTAVLEFINMLDKLRGRKS